MHRAHYSYIVVLLLTLSSATALSAERSLNDASPYDRWSRGQSLLSVAVAPQLMSTQPYFTADSLKQKIANLHPAHIRADWCRGKEKQRGVVVFTNGDVVFWYSCAPERIVFEGDAYPGAFGFIKP